VYQAAPLTSEYRARRRSVPFTARCHNPSGAAVPRRVASSCNYRRAAAMTVVLVVDDEPFVAEVIAIALEDEGYDVISATNGEEGLRRLSEQAVDVVITDHMMPVLDGPAMVRQIRALPGYASIPIILISALQPADLGTACPGANRFLLKPFTLRNVIKTVWDLLPR
jgi:CheY-like chemotaxis protein